MRNKKVAAKFPTATKIFIIFILQVYIIPTFKQLIQCLNLFVALTFTRSATIFNIILGHSKALYNNACENKSDNNIC